VRQLGTDAAAENKGGVAVTAYQRKATVGGADKMHREGPFYNYVSRRGNADLRKERGREVTTRLGVAAERACAHVA
jgi:hypothetical protein